MFQLEQFLCTAFYEEKAREPIWFKQYLGCGHNNKDVNENDIALSLYSAQKEKEQSASTLQTCLSLSRFYFSSSQLCKLSCFAAL